MRKRDGSSLTYSYDALNRMTVKDAPGTAADVACTYDLRNLQLTALFSATSQGVTNSYDGFGRLASQSTNMGGTTRTLTYQYDRDGDRTRITHPDATYFSYGYDGLDRGNSILENGATSIGTVAFYPTGEPISFGRSGSSSGFTFDAVGRLSGLSHDLVGTTSDVTYGYTRNAASQIGSVTRSNDSYAWAGLYTVTRNYTPNGLNQYGSIATVGGSTLTLAHDANGNLTSDGAGGNTYSYDIENRMVSVSGAHAATLAYDPLGRLWQMTSGANVTQFLYDGDNLVAEYNGSGTLVSRYVHAGSADTDDPRIWYASGARRYLFPDHQGSIVAVSDSSGNLIAADSYDEYGIPGASNLGRFQYTGQAWLNELGLYYYKARMYSPTLGRFMQVDPIGYADQFNLYEYVGDDPANRADPTGKQLVEHFPADHELVTRVNAMVATGRAQTVRVDPQTSMTLSRSGRTVSVAISHTETIGHGLFRMNVTAHLSGSGTLDVRPGQVAINGVNLRSDTFLVGVTAAPTSVVMKNDPNGSVRVQTNGPLVVSTPTGPVTVPAINRIANPPPPPRRNRERE